MKKIRNQDCNRGIDLQQEYPAASLAIYAVVCVLAVTGLVMLVIA